MILQAIIAASLLAPTMKHVCTSWPEGTVLAGGIVYDKWDCAYPSISGTCDDPVFKINGIVVEGCHIHFCKPDGKGYVCGHDIPAPSNPHHRLFHRTDWSLIAADAATRTLDVYSTHQMLHRGYHELILPHAIADSTPRMAAYSGLCVVGNALVAHWLAKHGHRRKGEMYLTGDVAQDGFWATRNLTLRKLKPGEVVR